MQPQEVLRPWGGYTTVSFLPGLGSLKLLRVAPSSRLSLQLHSTRSEHWVVLAGEVLTLVAGRARVLRRGEHLEVPRGAWHRLQNASDSVDALLAEVQVGEYESAGKAEADIERAEDDYGRT